MQNSINTDDPGSVDAFEMVTDAEVEEAVETNHESESRRLAIGVAAKEGKQVSE